MPSLSSRAATAPPDFRACTDEDLRRWIVEAHPRWQEAYDALLHERYGGVLKNAMAWAEKRYGTRLAWEMVIEQLFLNLYGAGGTWAGLKSWTSEKGSFARWLWVVVRNVCNRMLRERNPLEEAERIHPIGEQDETGPRVAPPHPDPTAEDIVALRMLLEQVGPECAQLLRWKYYVGLTDADIGQRKGVGREWANRQRRRCERQLAELLHREGLRPSDFNV